MSRTRNINESFKEIGSNRRPVPKSYEELFASNAALIPKIKNFLNFLEILEMSEDVYLFGLKYKNSIPPKSKRLLFGDIPISLNEVKQKSISTVIVGNDLITKLYYSLSQSDMDIFKGQLNMLLEWTYPNDLSSFDEMHEIFKIGKKIEGVHDFFKSDSPAAILGPRTIKILRIDSIIEKLIESGILTQENYEPKLNTAYLNPQAYSYIAANYPEIIISVLNQTELTIDQVENIEHELNDQIILPPPDPSRPIIGVIDAGCQLPEIFSSYIDDNIDMRESDTSHDYFHGTAVSSLIIAHDQINTSSPDNLGNFKVRHFELFKIKSDTSSYFYIKSTIENIVRGNLDIKIWNLSFGGLKSPYDINISELGILLDDLSSELEIIFIIASGNDRDRTTNLFESLNSPGDSLNSLTVGSVKRDEIYKYAPSNYSSIGPILHYEKPEVSSFGGPNNIDNSPLALLDNNGIVYGKNGTSFSTPKITRHIAYFVSNGYTPYEAKAKVIAIADKEIRNRRSHAFPGWKSSAYGVVAMEQNTYDLKITMNLSGKKPVYFPIELVDNIEEITMVGCFSTKPKPDLGEEYSISNIELGLLWHKDIDKPEWRNVSKLVDKDVITDKKTYGSEIYQRYENAKWFPTTKVSSSISAINQAKTVLINEKNIPEPLLSLRIRKQDLFNTVNEQVQKVSIVISLKGDFDFDAFEARNTQLIEQEIEQEIET